MHNPRADSRGAGPDGRPRRFSSRRRAKERLRCGACASVCPLGLINVDDSDDINPGCLKCNTCVKTCPIGSMQFRQEDFLEVARNCEETFGKETREPEVWFAE